MPGLETAPTDARRPEGRLDRVRHGRQDRRQLDAAARRPAHRRRCPRSRSSTSSDGIQAARYDGAARSATKTASVFADPDHRGRRDAGLRRRGRDVRDDRLVAADHRGQGVPGRPERGVRQAASSASLGRLEQREKSAARDLKQTRPSARRQVAATAALATAYTGAARRRSASSTSARPTRSSTRSSSRRCAPPAAPTRRPRPRAAPRTAPATSARARRRSRAAAT